MNEATPTHAHTLKSAATCLQLSERKVATLIAEGKLRSFKIGRSRRVSDDAIREFVREMEAAD